MSEKQSPDELRQQEQQQQRRRASKWDAFLAVVVDSVTSLSNNLPAQAAASIAYYFLFSIFPLFLFVVIFLSYFLDFDYVQTALTNFIQGVIPGAEVLISQNLQSMLDNRTSTSIIASVSLLWSGSGMINSIISNVQKAWPESKMRGYFINRALAIAMILIAILLITGMMVFSFVFDLSNALAFFRIKLTPALSLLIRIFSSFVLPLAFLYLLGFALYYMIPTAKVDRKAARIAALVFAVACRLFTFFFSKYILSPLNRYDLLYGSVTAIVLLLLYIYFTAFIILYCAHLTAAITHYRQRREGILASAPINPRPIRQKKLKGAKGAANRDPYTLSDPVVLKPDPVEPKKTFWGFIKDMIKDLFRWK